MHIKQEYADNHKQNYFSSFFFKTFLNIPNYSHHLL